MIIALHRGRGFIGKAIQWQTRSVYSHASVLVSEATAIEAREFIGVRCVLANMLAQPGERVDFFTVAGLTEAQAAIAGEFLWAQVGKSYDYTMVARFISRRQADRKQAGKWFCSELVFAALAKAGVELLARVEPWEVSPGLLARSPLLIPLPKETHVS